MFYWLNAVDASCCNARRSKVPRVCRHFQFRASSQNWHNQIYIYIYKYGMIYIIAGHSAQPSSKSVQICMLVGACACACVWRQLYLRVNWTVDSAARPRSNQLQLFKSTAAMPLDLCQLTVAMCLCKCTHICTITYIDMCAALCIFYVKSSIENIDMGIFNALDAFCLKLLFWTSPSNFFNGETRLYKNQKHLSNPNVLISNHYWYFKCSQIKTADFSIVNHLMIKKTILKTKI